MFDDVVLENNFVTALDNWTVPVVIYTNAIALRPVKMFPNEQERRMTFWLGEDAVFMPGEN